MSSSIGKFNRDRILQKKKDYFEKNIGNVK